ncbi:DUF1016 N-terminal domain-containing protein [Segetibacter sp.]|jgi:hypothetical protein|uniref:DUF1016 N-terminal domain-containing protein n=1 Tax=Segetibacter sp. TaxID=2231182 RepID=UPI0026193581|nr:DUF1016 N-terminal domain-containing protein [Segetibacter sp.]MCW3081703.1 hypothetical protein [Segetibacter sp.]
MCHFQVVDCKSTTHGHHHKPADRQKGGGEMIFQTLSLRLEREYGKGFSEKNLRRVVQFYQVFPDYTIVVSLIRQLSWTHFIALIPLKMSCSGIFTLKCAGWKSGAVATLLKKIQSMLFERTAISKKTDELASLEL